MKKFNEQHYNQHLGHIYKVIRTTGITEFMEYDDAIQESNILYLEAYEEFKVEKGLNFAKYLTQKIEWRFNTIIKQRIRDGKTIQMRHTLSLDKVSSRSNGEQQVPFSEFVPDTVDVEKTLIAEEQRDALHSYMMESDFKGLYTLVIQDYNLETIGMMLNVSRATAYRKRKKMTEFARDFMETTKD